MNYLGIDFGLKHIGLAANYGSPLAEPLTQIAFDKSTYKKITLLCQKHKIEQIVVGFSEGKMANKTLKFVNDLKKHLDLPVLLQDETLSSAEAKKALVEAHVKRKKRRSSDHQAAAAIILQEFLDR